MKKNGFMVVECIIASVVVLTVIILLYTQVKAVSRTYAKSYNYDNVTSLYALSNFRTFLLDGDNYDKLLQSYFDNKKNNTSNCGKYYVYVSCSIFSGPSINYCDTLLNTMGITTNNARPRQIIFTSSNISELKSCDFKNDSGFLRSTFVDYILSLSSNEVKDKYMLIAEFDDDTLASLNIYRASEVQNED